MDKNTQDLITAAREWVAARANYLPKEEAAEKAIFDLDLDEIAREARRKMWDAELCMKRAALRLHEG